MQYVERALEGERRAGSGDGENFTCILEKCDIMKMLALVLGVVVIPGSSMVEQEAVNFEVTGSSPVRGANLKFLKV